MASHGEPAALAAWLVQEADSAGIPLPPTWDAVRQLCQDWSRPASAVSTILRDIWLEFDAHSLIPSGLGEVTPSLFAGMIRREDSFEASWSAVDTILPFLAQGRDLSPFRGLLERCRTVCPSGARVSHVGMMLGRESIGCRVNLGGIRCEQMGDFLRSLEWPGDEGLIERLAAKLFELVDEIVLCLDLRGQVQARLGLECVFLPSPATDPRLERLVQYLVEQGLCSAPKGAALLQWPGLLLPSESAAPWPAALIARDLLQPVDRLGVFHRGWNHLKLVCEPGRPLVAKGYLNFGPGETSTMPESSTALATAHAAQSAGTVTRQPRRRALKPGARLAAAIEAATTFLVSARRQSGLWREFSFMARSDSPARRTPSVSSDEYVSGYVGAVLAAGRDASGREAARRAWDLLLARRSIEDGWGWNAQSPPDADSTAWVLRMVDALHQGSRERIQNARRFLLRRMSPEGGLACFPRGLYRPLGSPDGWSAPNASITAAAAVLGLGPAPAEFLVREQRGNGSWTDYWWDDDEYTTARAVEALLHDGRPASRAAAQRAVRWAINRIGADGSAGESPFATGLCLEILALGQREGWGDPVLLTTTEWLLDQQEESGCFRPSARMRIPPADAVSLADWSGPVQQTLDDSAVFTTATVLRGLNALYFSGPGAPDGE